MFQRAAKELPPQETPAPGVDAPSAPPPAGDHCPCRGRTPFPPPPRCRPGAAGAAGRLRAPPRGRATLLVDDPQAKMRSPKRPDEPNWSSPRQTPRRRITHDIDELAPPTAGPAGSRRAVLTQPVRDGSISTCNNATQSGSTGATETQIGSCRSKQEHPEIPASELLPSPETGPRDCETRSPLRHTEGLRAWLARACLQVCAARHRR